MDVRMFALVGGVDAWVSASGERITHAIRLIFRPRRRWPTGVSNGEHKYQKRTRPTAILVEEVANAGYSPTGERRNR